MTSQRAIVRGAGALVAIAIATASLFASQHESDAEETTPGPGLELLAAKGQLRIENSRAGSALVSTRNMAPGDARVGTVRVGVLGVPASVGLHLERLRNPPGPFGGRLTDALMVRVRRLSGPHRRLLFRGHPTELSRIPLGRWQQGRSRRYRIRVRFNGSRARQNQLQGATASFAIVWRASAAR